MRRLAPAALGLIAIACFAFGFATTARADDAADRAEIDRSVDAALAILYKTVPGSNDIANKAAGVLVFPEIVKAGLVIGGQHGEGALRVGGKTVGYYSTSGASLGLQAGAETHSMALMFMTQEALNRFQNGSGWDLGGDASVAVVDIAANGSIDTAQLGKPVEAFIYGSSGLMASLSLEGTKVSKMDLAPDSAVGSSTPK